MKNRIAAAILLSTLTTASYASIPFSSAELGQVKDYLFSNISTKDRTFVKHDEAKVIRSLPGAIIASPSNREAGFSQDYQFHWTRDAALTMAEVVSLYTMATGNEKTQLKNYLINYINFERTAQKQISNDGEQTLGQPKFNIDGTVWEGPWGRPQNDGSALRAITMIAIAKIFIKEGDEDWVKEHLLNVIVTDLNYLVSQWQSPNYDIWEEVNDADHFFTKMVQRKSLIEGASLFDQLGDKRIAENYKSVASQLTDSLQKHWIEGRGYLTETVNQQFYKGGGLDSSILLGALYGNLHEANDPFSLDNDRIMSTIFYLRNTFTGLYRVNLEHVNTPPLMGRYLSDIYDGNEFVYGNPWILITNALAEYYYSLANLYREHRQIQVTKNNILFFKQINPQLVEKEGMINDVQKINQIVNELVAEGDKCLAVVKQYSTCYADGSCLHFAEQVDRSSGQPVSAKDLTWGYATLLSAVQARG